MPKTSIDSGSVGMLPCFVCSGLTSRRTCRRILITLTNIGKTSSV